MFSVRLHKGHALPNTTLTFLAQVLNQNQFLHSFSAMSLPRLTEGLRGLPFQLAKNYQNR